MRRCLRKVANSVQAEHRSWLFVENIRLNPEATRTCELGPIVDGSGYGYAEMIADTFCNHVGIQYSQDVYCIPGMCASKTHDISGIPCLR